MGMEKNALICGSTLEEIIDFEFYKILFEPVRSEILTYLACHGKKNISEISENFTQDRSVISRHLDLMHRSGMVHKTKVNRYNYYQINAEFIVGKFDNTTENLKQLLLKKKTD